MIWKRLPQSDKASVDVLNEDPAELTVWPVPRVGQDANPPVLQPMRLIIDILDPHLHTHRPGHVWLIGANVQGLPAAFTDFERSSIPLQEGNPPSRIRAHWNLPEAEGIAVPCDCSVEVLCIKGG